MITPEEFAKGRMFLHTLNSRTLEAMLNELLPGVQAGEAGTASWAAVTAIRGELERRVKGEPTKQQM